MGEGERPRLRLVDDREVSTEVTPSPVAAGSGSFEPTSFSEAFTHNYAFAYRMLRTYGVEPALLDDAAQEVFLVVHRRWGDYDGRRAFRSWLVGIIRRVASSYRRSARRLRARLANVAPVSTASSSPEDTLAQRERLARVEVFVNQLGVRHREVFVLSELEGMTAPEIAEILELKINTVYSRIRVARERFCTWHEREREAQAGKEGGRDQAR